MPKPRTFTKMVGADAEKFPAIRIEFKGKYQVDYFSLHKIADEDFEGSNGTALARLILHDWIESYRTKKRDNRPTGAQQLIMLLRADANAQSERAARAYKAKAGKG